MFGGNPYGAWVPYAIPGTGPEATGTEAKPPRPYPPEKPPRPPPLGPVSEALSTRIWRPSNLSRWISARAGVERRAVVAGGDLLDVVHGRDGLLRVILIGVSHEAETPTPAGVAILDDNLLKMLVFCFFCLPTTEQ